MPKMKPKIKKADTTQKVSKKPVKRKNEPIKKLQERLWTLCKEIVRKRDGNVCVICNKSGLEGSGWHTGHFIPSSICGAYLRYDLRNLHSSCYNCNINLGGNGAIFSRQLTDKFGKEFVDKIFQDKNIIIKADNIFYEGKIEEYEKIRSWNKSKLLDHTRFYSTK